MRTARSSIMLGAVLLCSVFAANIALAKPTRTQACSKHFCVESTPGADTVFRCTHQPDSDRCHWSIPGWHQHIFVSDYGVVAVVYDGGYLLPIDYDPATVLIQLWKNGRMVREIRASEIDGVRQRRIGSQYEWGLVRGFDQNFQLIVTTRSGKRVKISDPPEQSFNYFPPTMVDEFKAQWYGRFLNAFEEPSLWEFSKKSPNQSYRFTWLRSFHHPVVIRIEVKPDGICELTAKVGLGAGGYDPGMLIRNDTRPLTRQQSEWFLNQLALRFWNPPKELSERSGLDGAQWIIEGVDNGRYQIEDKWSPNSGPIRELGLAMIDLADLRIPDNEIY